MSDLLKIKEKIQNMKLLYVEDENVLREVTADFLDKVFITTITANDGLDGLEKFKKSPNFDIIITDINMPGINGIEMAEAIKDLKENIIVVFISAEQQISSIKEDENIYTLIKPVQIEDFIELFGKLCCLS